MFTKIKTYLLGHKILSAIGVVIILFGGYKLFFAKTVSGQTLYVLGSVQKGLVISTVSASGQVSATDQLDIKAKVTGPITWVGVAAGDKVYAGQALASIDNTNAKQAVTDAEASLATAKLQLQKDQAQAPIDYQTAVDDLATAKTDLATEYVNTFNAISNTFLDLPTVVTGMQSTLYGYTLSSTKSQANADVLVNLFNNTPRITVQTFATQAESDYTTARAAYDPALLTYKRITRTSSTDNLETMLGQSINTTTAIAQALQSQLNFLGEVIDVANQNDIVVPTAVTTLQNSARGYLSTVNSDLNALLAEQKSLQSAKQTITTDQQNITLLQVGNPDGSNPISLQISQSDITKQEEDLANLKTALNEYTVVAPFAGTLSAVDAIVGDSAGTVATIITNQQVALLSLNEVDTAKISLGDKATLTFDAIDGLSITGTVAEIDSVGTVSQGVVSYSVKITFDTQDARIKPGMTVNADIQTAAHQDTLYVPSSAVKTTNGTSYVQVFNPPLVDTTGSAQSSGIASPVAPTQLPVTTGISDDTNVEILSGLTEGQQIVVRTTTATVAKATTATSATSLLGGNRAGGFGGGATRAPVTRGG